VLVPSSSTSNIHWFDLTRGINFMLTAGQYGGLKTVNFPSHLTMLTPDQYLHVLRDSSGNVIGLTDPFGQVYSKALSCFDAATTFTSRMSPSALPAPRRADALRVGDEVLVAARDGSLVWDRIAVDASHGPGNHSYIKIETASNHVLHLSPSHYLHAAKMGKVAAGITRCCTNTSLMLAGQVETGDVVWTTGTSATASVRAGMAAVPSVVTAVSTVVREGAYNFVLEQAGDMHFRSLVAEGVVASSFTTDWRLISSFGFDVADQMRKPLRQLYQRGLRVDGGSINSVPVGDTDLFRSPVMHMMYKIEGVVADCVEQLLNDCSEDAVEKRINDIIITARVDMSPDLIEVLEDSANRLIAQGTGLPEGAVRRARALLRATTDPSSLPTNSSMLARILAKEAVHMAVDICVSDSRCKDGMPVGHVAVPIWSLPVLVVASIASPFLCCIALLCVCICWRLRRQAKAAGHKKPLPASVVTAAAAATMIKAAGAAVEVLARPACSPVVADTLKKRGFDLAAVSQAASSEAAPSGARPSGAAQGASASLHKERQLEGPLQRVQLTWLRAREVTAEESQRNAAEMAV